MKDKLSLRNVISL